MSQENTFVLASGSPRRRELLERFFPSLEIMASDIEENIPSSATLLECKDLAEELALAKAKDVQLRTGGVALGADTLVVCDGHVMGKPNDIEKAKSMLRLLSGKSHHVVTGIAAVSSWGETKNSIITEVCFRQLSKEDISSYLDAEEWQDKAGAYAIQSHGWKLMEKITGSWSNIVGLPLYATAKMLKEHGIQMDTSNKSVIVAVGMPGAGKEELVKMARKYMFAVVRMGDVVRDEATKQGVDTSDVGIGGFASAQREEHGKDIWAQRTLDRVSDLDSSNTIIDGTRSPYEIEVFRETLGDSMILAAVTVDQKTRYERLVARGRSDAPVDLDAFKVRDDRELGWGIKKALELADVRIPNEGTLEEFQQKAREFFESL